MDEPDMAMHEKRIRQLPAIRISESLEVALLRLSARHDRSLSEYVRAVLEQHAFGHAQSMLPAANKAQA